MKLMAEKLFILTLDYELYGNGSGDVFRNVVEPTERLLAIARERDVKYTFFFEVVEYWCLKREWESGNRMSYDRDPVAAMEEQIRRAVSEGHDVQLHIHPQWCGAQWRDGQWLVDNSQWRLADYAGDLADLLRHGKQTLEDIVRQVKPDYECIALRAGGYNAWPSERIVSAMREVGLRVDSSVVPGAIEAGALSRYDYSGAPRELGSWHVADKLETPAVEATDILELPIVSQSIVRFTKFLSWSRVKAILQNRKSAMASFEAKTDREADCTKQAGACAKLWTKLKFMFEREYQTWDFCLFSMSMHKKYIKNVITADRSIYTLVGHPKGFNDAVGLLWFIDNLECGYTTISCIYKELIDN